MIRSEAVQQEARENTGRTSQRQTRQSLQAKDLKAKARALIGALMTFSCIASAGEPDIEMMTKMKKLYPATTFTGITKSPIAGLWEVQMGEQLAYTDASGQYLFLGSVIDLKTQRELTPPRKAEVAPTGSAPVQPKVAFPSNFLSNAIKTVRGDGSRVVAVFSDPMCPHCISMEREMAKLQNVTIYTFLYPIVAEASKVKSVSIWCSGNREKSWQDAMQANKSPKLAHCANPINDNLVLGSRLGIQATPALVAADGRLFVGATSMANVDKWLMASSQ